MFETLGAIISLPQVEGGPIEVENKPSRIEQLKDQVLTLKQHFNLTISRSFLESLKGRFLYASGHTFGKCSQLACQLLHRVSGTGASIKVSAELIHVVSEALELLATSKPRRVDRWSETPPVLVFTDGAVEDNCESVTHGALLIDPLHHLSLVFGDVVPQHFVRSWTKFGKRQVIAQAEIFPVLVAKETWANELSERSVMWFLDNEAAKMSLIRNYSPVMDSFVLLQTNAALDVRSQSKNWYSRVPSRSNPSDSASRLKFDEYVGSSRSSPSYALVTEAFNKFDALLESLKMGRS